jgi:hypothetical protein
MLLLIELWVIYLFWPLILAFLLLCWLGTLLVKMQGPEPARKEYTPIVDGPTPAWHWVYHGFVVAFVGTFIGMIAV